jgi:hypothetical protein
MVERINEFIQLRKSAMDILNDTTSPNEHLHLVVFTSVYPSFDNLFSWSIFADVDEQTFTARHAYWDYKFDGKRFGDPFAGLKYGWDSTPTFHTVIFAVDTATIHRFLSEAQTINLIQPTRKGIVLDGTPRTLYVKDAFGDVTHEWNAEPDEYKPMIEWTDRLIAYLAPFIKSET